MYAHDVTTFGKFIDKAREDMYKDIWGDTGGLTREVFNELNKRPQFNGWEEWENISSEKLRENYDKLDAMKA